MSRRTNRKSRRSSRQRPTKTDTSASGSGRDTDFNPDYSYVIKDLKRILLYAGGCIAILVILSFIL